LRTLRLLSITLRKNTEMDEPNMFDEDREYWRLAEKLIDSYELEDIMSIAEVDPKLALVELMLAGVLTVDEDNFPELFDDEDDE
jgi:hypothetical protein